MVALGVINDNWGTSLSSVTGGGVSSWHSATAVDYDGTDGQMLQIWYGVVASAGASTLKLTWSASVGNYHLDLEEFSAGAGATWSVGPSATSASPFPSLKAPASGALYYGAAFAWGNAAAGATPGVSYSVLASSFLIAWDTSPSGALSPTGTGAGSVAVLLEATT